MKGISALSEALPDHWLLYASFLCLLPHGQPIEVDLMVAMDDRLLLIELRDIGAEFTVDGDVWISPGGARRQSAVHEVAAKAKQLKGHLLRVVGDWRRDILVDSVVVLTGAATGANVQGGERASILTLEQACALGDPTQARRLLRQARLSARRPHQHEAELDKAFGNPRFFGPRETLWSGCRVTTENIVQHPRKVWSEHLGEQARDARNKVLIRIWAFDQLPVALNSVEARPLVAGREDRAIAMLSARSSPLMRRGLLLPVGDRADEILTQHVDLRRLPEGGSTLDRFLEQAGTDLADDDRRTLASALMVALRDLHAAGIAHRDLGFRNVWVSGMADVSLTGLMASDIPGEELDPLWLDAIRANRALAHDAPTGETSKALDVRAAGRLVRRIVHGKEDPATADGTAAVGVVGAGFQEWFARTSSSAAAAFTDAIEATSAYAAWADEARAKDLDVSPLARHARDREPSDAWPLLQMLVFESTQQVYKSRTSDGHEAVVTIWIAWRGDKSAEAEIDLLRTLDGAERISLAGRGGLPSVLDFGIARIGAYIVTRPPPETTWDDVVPTSAPEAIAQAVALLKAMEALHGFDIDHGDIRAANVRLDASGTSLQLAEVFRGPTPGPSRPTALGDGMGMVALETTRQADRRAAILLARDRIAPFGLGGTEDEGNYLEKELALGPVQLLEPAIGWLERLSERLARAARPIVRVHVPGEFQGAMAQGDAPLFARAFMSDPGIVRYVVTGVDWELTLAMVSASVPNARMERTRFASLAKATSSGTALDLDVIVTDDPQDDPSALAGALAHVPVAGGRAGSADAANEGEELDQIALDGPDVRTIWRRSLELEEQAAPAVRISELVHVVGEEGVYKCQLASADFDFDPDANVEAALPGSKPIATVDIGRTDSGNLTVRFRSHRRFDVGDVVLLLDRGTRDSLNRRRRAVERILRNGAQIDRLVDYFDPSMSMAAHDTGLVVPDEELEAYGLNDGQKEAFRHVARHGPVSLQQGPPGTGKTRFIAAFVHWLVTRQGVGRILIASQSHEAVNTAIEAIVRLHSKIGGDRMNLLRLGSKNITTRVRPFHSATLRDRYRIRFDAAFAHRIVSMASTMGVSRDFTRAAIDLDAGIGARGRVLQVLRQAAADQTGRSSGEELRSDAERLDEARLAFDKAVEEVLGPGHSDQPPEAVLASALDSLAARHEGDISPSDVRTVASLIGLGHEWIQSLSTKGRNFEEFLAKTRTIVTATCVGVGHTRTRIDARPFDWVIVDEAARCTSGELAIPLHLGRRVLLVGDHLQLKPMMPRPVTKGLEAEMPASPPQELQRSDFERAFTSAYGRDNGRTFTEQYRMAPAICRIVSDVFYKPNQVLLRTSHNRRGNDAFSRLAEPFDAVAAWIDTRWSPDNRERKIAPDDTSFLNRAEIAATMGVLRRLSKEPALVAGLRRTDEETPIGVICMYEAQRAEMQAALDAQAFETTQFRSLVRVETVDAYQGKENTVIVMSLVRSNPARVRGHVASYNRCNVALSRACERLYVVGSSAMWSRTVADDPMRRVWEHFGNHTLDTRIMRPEDFS